MSTATRSNAGRLLQSIGGGDNPPEAPAPPLNTPPENRMMPNLGTPNDAVHIPDINIRMGQISVPKPTNTDEAPSPSGQARPQSNKSTNARSDNSTQAMEAFVESKLNSAGGQRMGGKGAKPGTTFRSGPYVGMTTTQATEAIRSEWMAMHPNEREAWWQQNNPANGRTPSEGGPKGNGFGNLSNPFGKLGSPHAKLAPVSAAPTLSAPVGDMNLLAQSRADTAAGITSRGTNGSVQYANGASITPTSYTPQGDASMGPPQTTQSRVLSSPYGSGSVVDTGVKGPPGRINWSNTYDPNFFNQQQQTQQQSQQLATNAQSSPPPTTVATQPSPAFSPAYNALIDKQNRPGPLPKLPAGTVIGQSAAPSIQPPVSLPALATGSTTGQSRLAAPSLQPPGSFSSPPPSTSNTAMSTAQQAGSLIRAIPGTVAGVTMGGTSGLANGYYGAMTGPARAGYNAGQNGIPQTAGEFSAGLTGASVGAAKSAGSQISSPLGANSPIAQSFADTRKTTPTDNNN